jgi:hypothetical protein
MKKLILVCFLFMLLISLFDISVALYPAPGWTLFEDNSFIWGKISGCLPWGLCARPYSPIERIETPPESRNLRPPLYATSETPLIDLSPPSDITTLPITFCYTFILDFPWEDMPWRKYHVDRMYMLSRWMKLACRELTSHIDPAAFGGY